MVGISLKIAVQMKKTKLSFLNVALSFIAGISCAWLLSDLIHLHVNDQYQSICIAIIAISGEKVGDFLVYKLRVDEFLQAVVVALKEVLIKMINK
jgi:hypothetical protein